MEEEKRNKIVVLLKILAHYLSSPVRGPSCASPDLARMPEAHSKIQARLPASFGLARQTGAPPTDPHHIRLPQARSPDRPSHPPGPFRPARPEAQMAKFSISQAHAHLAFYQSGPDAFKASPSLLQQKQEQN